MTKNLNEIIKENEEGFEEYTIAKSWELNKDKFFIDATPEELKSHLHQSQLNIVEWVKQSISNRGELSHYDEVLLQELDKIV